MAPDRPLAPFARPGEQPEQVRLPFFVVQEAEDGTLTAAGVGYYDLSPGEAFDQTFLQELIQEVERVNRPSGELKQYHLRFLRVDAPFGQSVIFADTTSEQSTLNNLVKNCILIGVLCFFAFLGISIKLAAWTVKPVEWAWQQQRQFVSDASHELKTPLTVIMTNAELLQSEENDRDSQVRFSANILTMSRQMRALVEQMLELARRTAARERRTEAVDLSTWQRTLCAFRSGVFRAGVDAVKPTRRGDQRQRGCRPAQRGAGYPAGQCPEIYRAARDCERPSGAMGAPPLPADCKQSRPASLGGGAEGYFQALLSDRSSPEPGRQLRSGPLHRPAHHRGAPRAHLGGEQRWIQSLHRGTSGPVTKQTKMLVE